MGKTKITEGTEVWFFDPYGSLFHGRVRRTVDGYAEVKGIGGSIGTCGVRIVDCHLTKEECITAQAEKSNRMTAGYKAQITDVESLVRFMYRHNVACCEEYTDWEARRAVEERAKELLGICL